MISSSSTPQKNFPEPAGHQRQIGLTGASGFIGKAFQRAAEMAGHQVVGFSRTPGPGQRLLAEMDFSGLDAVVHLAGEPVLGLWTAGKRQRIYDSRVRTTQAISEALLRLEKPPECFVMSSGINGYGERGAEILTEDSAFGPGKGLLAKVVLDWEGATQSLQGKVRVTALRLPVVLGRGGGAFAAMSKAFRWGLGGNLGSGRQWWPWVHLADVVGLLLRAVENPAFSGPINAVAPEMVTNAEFTKMLAKTLHRPAFFHTPAFLLKCLPGGMGDIFLESMKIQTKRALELGYTFQHPILAEALASLTSQP